MYLLGAGGAPPPPPAKSNTIINTRKHDILIPLTIATIVSLRPSFLATFANGPGNLDGVFDATFRSPPPPPDGDGDGAGLLPLDGAGLLPLAAAASAAFFLAAALALSFFRCSASKLILHA